MNLVCLIYVVCVSHASNPHLADPKDEDLTCKIVTSDCMSVPEKTEEKLRAWCSPSPRCFEPHPRIFVLREMATAPETYKL